MSIRTLYVIQHSHTDIGYTDLQENVIEMQVDNIMQLLSDFQDPKNKDYRWVCETLFIVKRFLKEATEEQKKQFVELVKAHKIGLSLNYLNFNDLVDSQALSAQLKDLIAWFESQGVKNPRVAMCADINGISMGQRDALLDNGIEFLYMNINETHGKVPFGKRHIPYYWEAEDGRKLLVWSAEHYNTGNALGLRHEKVTNGFFQTIVGNQWDADPVENIKKNLDFYLDRVERSGYPYDFLPMSVSGIFTDNAPANTEIIRNIEAYTEKYPDGVKIQMVTLDELYQIILPQLKDVPTVKGDMTDWWADGVGCSVVAAKHYMDARREYHKLSAVYSRDKHTELWDVAEENLLLYAEHTMGHSATASHPYLTAVCDLDTRKRSYASKAHEAVMTLANYYRRENEGIARLYHGCGTLVVKNPSNKAHTYPISFEIEANPTVQCVRVQCGDREMLSQCGGSTRGLQITFMDSFEPNEEKVYTFEACARPETTDNPCVMTENSFENAYVRIAWENGKGITSWFDKEANKELVSDKDTAPFMTPLFEQTPEKHGVMGDRGVLGLNIRGAEAKTVAGTVLGCQCEQNGPLYTDMRLDMQFEGCYECHEFIRMWHTLRRVDVHLQMCKYPNRQIESVYMPLTLNAPIKDYWIQKGSQEAFRPLVDQLPNTCDGYAMSDEGVLFQTEEGDNYFVSTLDTPLVAFAPFAFHETQGCAPQASNADIPVRAWVMNNKWETNFPLDLSGFYECRYRWSKVKDESPNETFITMRDDGMGADLLIRH